jgi:hypothetical protein
MTGNASWHRRPAVYLAGVACVALCAIGFGVGATSAVFSDRFVASAGTVGNPNEFELQTKSSGEDWLSSTVAKPASFTSVGGASSFTKDSPVIYKVVVRNGEESDTSGVNGIVRTQLFDPDPASSGTDLFDQLRFTIALDGEAEPLATLVTAAEFNALDHAVTMASGTSMTLKIEVFLDYYANFTIDGARTAIGVQFEGVSTK